MDFTSGWQGTFLVVMADDVSTFQQNTLMLQRIERFSFECRKVIGFAFTTLRHFFIQSGVKAKPIVIQSYAFSRALRQLHVITSRFDWFT